MTQAGTILLDAVGVDEALGRISLEILDKHVGKEPVLVGIHTRGVYLARRLQEKMEQLKGFSAPLGSVDINLYRDDWTRISQQPVLQATDIPFSIDERDVILVDDVLYTGRTVRAAMDALIDFGRPDRIELAVLVDRGHRELPIQADYVGTVVKTSRSQRVNVLAVEKDGRDQVILD